MRSKTGDTISHKLFTATLRRLNWENKGVKIDGEFLSNLRFADDIILFLCTKTPQELRNNMLIENVEGNVYLKQHYSIKEKNQVKEIQRRIMAGWAAYAKLRDIRDICLKRQVYNSCALPAMPYGADTWTLTELAQN